MRRRLFNFLLGVSVVVGGIIVALSAMGCCVPQGPAVTWQQYRYQVWLGPTRGGFTWYAGNPNVFPWRGAVVDSTQFTDNSLWGRGATTYIVPTLKPASAWVSITLETVYVYYHVPFLVSLILPAWWLVGRWRARRIGGGEAGAAELGSESAALECDVACVRCGYNLRGLTGAGHCPECGLGVGRSLALGRELAESRPAWVRGLARGSKLVLVAQFLLMWAIPGAFFDEAAGAIVLLLAAISYGVGTWMLTAHENPHARPQPYRWLSRSLRVLATICLLGAAIMTIRVVSENRYYGPRLPVGRPIFSSNGAGPAAGLGIMAFLPCPLMQFILMRRLAVRVLDRHLTEHTTIVGIGQPLATAGLSLWLSTCRAPFMGSQNFDVTLATMTGFVLFCLWSTYIHAIFTVLLTKAARMAEASWRAADAGLGVTAGEEIGPQQSR